MMMNHDFLPNSPTLMNSNTRNNMLSACFLLVIEDSLEDIFQKLKDAALIFQAGGGVGYSFDNIRAKNSIVNSSGGKASGVISFMELYEHYYFY